METLEQQHERIAKKIAAAKWPEGLTVPTKLKLKLRGRDGNAFSILGRAREAALNGRKTAWTSEQWEAFRRLAMAGDYEHLLATCCDFFEVN